MSRQLYDLSIGTAEQVCAEITVGVDFDDDAAADQTLTYHLCSTIRALGGDASDLQNFAIDVRSHGYERVLLTFMADTWMEE